ncbi:MULTISPECIES: dihydrolipoyl dehydrogenase [Lysinibacillus]|uniref:Dihydrolipoyl dehydrogenase n=1 Tax=Lysinibacillus antri TaxID=2498145 RepID=A0A432LEM7_9BACI|nr:MULTISPECIES: dihydrolipoyl dehydrogenase [Lysinibacillus]RUL55498.1 dihydrolipoyl dehydrogenase [Lysinibacillus antri]TSI09062.1 dihydrolipoyl dehydrogenase [Lysinibacillus sp. BW-2-10]
MKKFDLTVIGAGAGGYVAAIHAAKSGLKVALVEKGKVGGACFNLGCIPSKIMLEHSKVIQTIRRANEWGIHVPTIDIDFPKLMQRKEVVIQQLLDDIHVFVQNASITFFTGEAKLLQDGVVAVNDEKIQSKHIILATGSKPFVPPFKGIETANYHTTDTIFNITELPKQLTIIGGGVIAVEMAFSLAPFGTKVTILNHSKDILQTEEPEARPIIRQKMHDLGINLVLDFEFQEIRENSIVTSRGNYEYENLLFATGRRANLEIVKDLNLEMDGRFIKVNDEYETSIPNLYAIGDIIGGFQLAHAASAEGIHAVEAILGNKPKPIDQTTVPRCVYTSPEIATFGLLEEEVKEPCIVTTLPLRTNPKALMEGNTEGFIKFIASQDQHEILGACVVGDGATEILNSMLAVKVAGGNADDLSKMIFPHPTVSEHIGDAARAVFWKAIHS